MRGNVLHTHQWRSTVYIKWDQILKLIFLLAKILIRNCDWNVISHITTDVMSIIFINYGCGFEEVRCSQWLIVRWRTMQGVGRVLAVWMHGESVHITFTVRGRGRLRSCRRPILLKTRHHRLKCVGHVRTGATAFHILTQQGVVAIYKIITQIVTFSVAIIRDYQSYALVFRIRNRF